MSAFGRIEPTLYLTAAMTGLRQGELIGLRRRDVDFDARRIRVVSPYGRRGDVRSRLLSPDAAQSSLSRIAIVPQPDAARSTGLSG